MLLVLLILIGTSTLVASDHLITIKYSNCRNSQPAANSFLALDAVRIVRVDKNKVVTLNTLYDTKPPSGSIRQAVFTNGPKHEISAAGKMPNLSAQDAANTYTILYVRRTYPDQDNDIFYGYNPNKMHWAYTFSNPTNQPRNSPYMEHPLHIGSITISEGSKTIPLYENKDCNDPMTWLAEHGIYWVKLNNRGLHNLYYDPYNGPKALKFDAD